MSSNEHIAPDALSCAESKRVVDGKIFSGCNLEGADWDRVRAKGAVFNDCNFSHGDMKKCYFRGVVFKNCDFTGARFSDCVLRGARFDGCTMNYAMFRSCILDVESVFNSAPSYENIRRELARELRKNAEGVGDLKGARASVWKEMEASWEHHRSIVKRQSGYYRNKYKLLDRFYSFFSLGGLFVSRYFWGYGESPLRLLIFALMVNAIFTYPLWRSATGCQLIDWQSIAVEQLLLFFGITSQLGCKFPGALSIAEAAARFILLGLVATVLIRRFANR